jgi:excisionase family DNA binding protein
MTVEEAAGLLGISRGTMYDRVRDGTVPSLKIGRKYLIPNAEFHEWVKAQSAIKKDVPPE